MNEESTNRMTHSGLNDLGFHIVSIWGPRVLPPYGGLRESTLQTHRDHDKRVYYTSL